MQYFRCYITCLAIVLLSCNDRATESASTKDDTVAIASNTANVSQFEDTLTPGPSSKSEPAGASVSVAEIDTKNVHPSEVISFAQTLVGTPYKYASIDPAVGFDCSGFITYVFNHFKINVPRSSIDFTNAAKVVEEHSAKQGDIILFTGTNPAEKFVGHMGLIVTNTPEIQFIHSSSGKANGVTITPLNDYYRTRFVKIIRIFKENDQ